MECCWKLIIKTDKKAEKYILNNKKNACRKNDWKLYDCVDLMKMRTKKVITMEHKWFCKTSF